MVYISSGAAGGTASGARLRVEVPAVCFQGKVQVQAIVEGGWKQMLVLPEGIRWLFPLDFAEAASVAHRVLRRLQDCVR